MKTNIGNLDLLKLLELATRVTEKFIALSENPDKDIKQGAYIGLWDKEESAPSLIVRLGICQKGKIEKYSYLAKEKILRLIRNIPNGHISSFQSRDPKNMVPFGAWGGAICVPTDSRGISQGKNMIGSVSGFSELGDEAIILVIFLACRWITITDAEKITAISHNNLFLPLLSACKEIIDPTIITFSSTDNNKK